MKVNIEDIKKMGAYISLEAELNTQLRYVDKSVKDRKWEPALNNLNNAIDVLNAIVELTNKLKQSEEPCILTDSTPSQETNSKP